MSIFRRDGAPAQPESPSRAQPAAPAPRRTAEAPKGGQKTLVAAGCKFEGKISGNSQVLVEGTVEGSIELENELVVGEKGSISGDVSARSVTISGKLKGNVAAAEKVELLPSGSIEGDVVAPRVAIAEGGFCKGKIEMNPSKGGKAAASA